MSYYTNALDKYHRLLDFLVYRDAERSGDRLIYDQLCATRTKRPLSLKETLRLNELYGVFGQVFFAYCICDDFVVSIENGEYKICEDGDPYFIISGMVDKNSLPITASVVYYDDTNKPQVLENTDTEALLRIVTKTLMKKGTNNAKTD